MLKTGRLPALLLVGFAAAQGGWDLLYWRDEWMRNLGANALQMLAGGIGAWGTWRAYRRLSGHPRLFWLLLCAGMLVYASSSLVYVYRKVSGIGDGYSVLTYSFWLLAYLIFLVALARKLKEMNGKESRSMHLFNMLAFTITAGSASVHFLIHPILAVPDPSLLGRVVALAFPLSTLGIFLVTLILYYVMLQQGTSSRAMRFVVWGMLCQVIGDSGFAYLTQKGLHQSGDPIDFLWLFALLLIGLGGFCAEDRERESSPRLAYDTERWETYFPYVSIVVLMCLVMGSYNWEFNALSGGMLLLVLLILGRQLQMMRAMNKLTENYRYLAFHDPLTGLKNRISFKRELEQIIAGSDARAGLLLIDLDRFKVVNDTLGHQAGDRVLVQAAERLTRSVGTRSPVYRLGGDEFLVMLSDAAEPWCAAAAEEILAQFRAPFLVGESEIVATPSIGISVFPDNGRTGEDLLKYADAAMYLAKATGRNGYRFYDTELHAVTSRKAKLENELRRAVERRQFKLVYQPKVELHTGRIVGMEALLRWEHPELGFVSPAEFIPIAEETGQIVGIGDWVLKQACAQNKAWQDKGYSPLRVSVNVSVRQFQHREFLLSVRKALQRTGLDAAYLELEITESIMQNVQESTEVLLGLRQMGISASIDDFGTGYSSLYIIPKLPIDTIKIDKSFIDDIDNRHQLSMLKAIIDIGLSLGLNVVAEGIESEHQRQVLVASGCPVGQGYFFSKPVSPKAFEEMMSAAREAVASREEGGDFNLHIQDAT